MLGMALDNISPDLRFYRDREASPFVLRVYAAHTPRERSPMRLRRIRLAISLHFARLCCAYAARTLAYAPAAHTARETFHETSLLVRVYAAHTPRERSPMRLRRIRLVNTFRLPEYNRFSI